MRFFNFKKETINTNISNDIMDLQDEDTIKRKQLYKELELLKKKPKLLKAFLNFLGKNVGKRRKEEKNLIKKIKNLLKDKKNKDKDEILKKLESKFSTPQTGGGLEKYFRKDNDKIFTKFKEFKEKEFKEKEDKEKDKKFLTAVKNEYNLKNLSEYDENDKIDLDKEYNPMQKFIDKFYEANNNYNNYNKSDEDNVSTLDKLENSKLKKLETDIYNAVNTYDNDPMNPDEILKINQDDRIVFITITFIIRYITLLLVNWCVEINIIKTFNQAFVLYALIYIVIFWFIVMIINVNISPDSSNSSSSILGNIQSVLFYFYFRINDIWRLLIHTLIIILLIIILGIIVQADKKEDIEGQYDVNYPPLTNSKKSELYKLISLFTIFMWIFTSIVAIKY